MTAYGLSHGSEAGSGTTVSVASADPITILRTNPIARRTFLAVATPRDPATGSEVTIRLSSDGYTTGPTDPTHPSETFYESLVRPYNAEISIFRGGVSSVAGGVARGSNPVSGVAVPGFGDIEIKDAEIPTATHSTGRLLDYLATLDWAGRTIKSFVGLSDRTFPEFAQIAQVTSDGLAWDLDAARIRVRDLRYKLDIPIQTTLYAGTGEAEGGDAVKGKPKPILYGQRRKIEPVMVDTTNLVLQFHDAAAHAVDEVLDQGVALAFAADYASYAALIAATVGGSQYATCLAEGLIRLGALPAGVITISARGDATGPGYVSNAVDIAERIITDRGGFTDFDIAGLAALEAANSSTTGVYVRGEQSTTISDEVAKLLTSYGAWMVLDRVGVVTMDRLVDPDSVAAAFSLTADDLREPTAGGVFERVPAGVRTYRVRLAHRPYQRVMSATDLADGVSAADRADFGESFRFVTESDPTVLTETPVAQVLEVETLLDDAAEATTEAARLLDLFKTERSLYTVSLESGLFSYFLGDVVGVSLVGNQYGLGTAKNFVVVGLVENASVDGSPDEIKLVLWG